MKCKLKIQKTREGKVISKKRNDSENEGRNIKNVFGGGKQWPMVEKIRIKTINKMWQSILEDSGILGSSQN